MITMSLASDDFGGLTCTLRDGNTEGVVRASKADEALADLAGAIDNLARGRTGECFWLRESGDYRWLLKRNGDDVRVVVLWSTGAMTGWENVFWADTEWSALESAFRSELARYAPLRLLS